MTKKQQNKLIEQYLNKRITMVELGQKIGSRSSNATYIWLTRNLTEYIHEKVKVETIKMIKNHKY